jgi:predicted  nucleic acid-binding Zn-ribbon protein
MKPVPNSLLLTLLLILCGLSSWQWHRESQLRSLNQLQTTQLSTLTTQQQELETRTKTADAEILRLTSALADLRAHSISKEAHEELLLSKGEMLKDIEKQNTTILQQNQLITNANTAIQQANATITKLSAERDGLAKRLNEVIAKYNSLAKKGGG